MARKYDRYGRNRQFRRNPTRNRRFFPYKLPFQADFRLNGPPSIGQYKRKVSDERYEHPDFSPVQYAKQIRNEFAIAAIESAIMAEVPLAAIPIAGFEMVRNPKYMSKVFGGSLISGVGAAAYLSSKNLI